MNTPSEQSENARRAFEEHGFSFVVYFPPEADWDKVQSFCDRITTLAYEGFFPTREGWDPFVFGYARDICGVDKGSSHVYLSTGCLHGNHSYCQGGDGFCGPKTPAICKFCAAPCICPCHTKRKNESDNVLTGE